VNNNPESIAIEEGAVQRIFAEIAVPSSSPGLLTYESTLSPATTSFASPGSIVEVDVRGRPKVGVVIAATPQPSYACKPILKPIWGQPTIPDTLVKLMLWVSQYYLCPLPRLIHLCAPGAIWKAAADSKRAKRYKSDALPGQDPPQLGVKLRGEQNYGDGALTLAPEQLAAVALILRGEQVPPVDAHAPAKIEFATTLLEGVTGSGKTEVYLACAKAVLALGRSVLVLVPEIALTPQMTMRFRAHFGQDLAVIHSGLTAAEVEREWYRIALGQARIVLGVRRGVFAPLRYIGLIIVDEEHDASYKSDDYPCVHSRDVAIKRAQLEGSLCILGSASPSLESHINVQRGLYRHVSLHRRQRGAQPQIEIFDSRPFFRSFKSTASNASAKTRMRSMERSTDLNFQNAIIMPQILHEIGECKNRGEQSIIIVNRRGFANFALCLSCGQAQKCPHCEVTTTLHKAGTLEICHHCGFKVTARTNCVSCSSTHLESRGFGTQMVEREIAQALPELKLERLDRDIMTSPTRLSELLTRFRAGESDALIGTQILSKGHDFPRVSLVAILHLEDSLFLPDFRSSERTFQLLLQSAGRAGRGEVPGRVVVQSLQPEHPVLLAVRSHQSEKFYRDETSLRRMAGLPPFVRQVLLLLENRDEIALSRDAYALKRNIDEHLRQSQESAVRVIGPHPAPVERLGGMFRAQIILCLPKNTLPRMVVPAAILGERFGTSGFRIDVDPQNFM
jgi:primosomal protein N' (replication factor Y)